MSHQKGVTHHVCCAPSTSMNQAQHLGSLCTGWGGFVGWGFRFVAVPPCAFPWLQGRSVKDSTLRRAQRRSFTPASFLEEDTVDFPDELDTSFFARVRGRSGMVLAQRQSRTLVLAGLCVAESSTAFCQGWCLKWDVGFF